MDKTRLLNLNLRSANPLDIDIITDLIAQSLKNQHSYPKNLMQTQSVQRYLFGLKTSAIRDGTYYLAEMDGQAVGCAGWSRRHLDYGEDHLRLLDPFKEAAHLCAIYVHPIWLRRNIGTRLIEVCERAAEESGFRTVELATPPEFVSWFRSHGYRQIREEQVRLNSSLRLPLTRMAKLMV